MSDVGKDHTAVTVSTQSSLQQPQKVQINLHPSCVAKQSWGAETKKIIAYIKKAAGQGFKVSSMPFCSYVGVGDKRLWFCFLRQDLAM